MENDMYHPRLKGTHYAMGQTMGTLFKRAKARFPIRLDPFQIDFGRKSGALLKRHFPEAAAEIQGVTDAIDHDHDLFTAWMMCMGCCLDLRHDTFVEMRGCTAFSFVRDHHVYYGRNNDLPPILKKVSKSIYYAPENKNRFILNTSSFINGEEAVNQHGLVVAMTFVAPKIEEIKPGLNSVFLVRYIAENCSTVSEAMAALQELPIASSCNILLADPQGAMAVVECNPFHQHIRYPEKSDSGAMFIVTVNHFTSPTMRRYDASRQDVYLSARRYQTAYNTLRRVDCTDGAELAKAILRGEYGFMCQYEQKLNFDTIWSCVLDLGGHKIYRAEGNPLKATYIDDSRLVWG